MKTKKLTPIGVSLIAGMLCVSAPAHDERALSEAHFKSLKLAIYEPTVYLLKSHGEELARLQFWADTIVDFEGAPWVVLRAYEDRGSATASNGVTLKINVGTNTVTITAQEVVLVKDTSAATVEKRQIAPAGKLIRLKSGGKDVAELRISKGEAISSEGKEGNYNVDSERITMKGKVTVEISGAQGSDVTASAEEIEMIRGSD